MNYLVQIRIEKEGPLDPSAWAKSDATTPENAAKHALWMNSQLHKYGQAWAWVADNHLGNLHPSGSPIMVHCFRLDWTGKAKVEKAPTLKCGPQNVHEEMTKILLGG